MLQDRGLNAINKNLEKPRCIQNFLNTTGNEVYNMYMIHGKVSLDYSGEQELSLRPLNRANIKSKYNGVGIFDTVQTRNLQLMRSTSVNQEVAKTLPSFANDTTLTSTLIAMNRLCEELSFFKNMRKATNVWGKKLLQLRFIVNNIEPVDGEYILGSLDCMKSFTECVNGLINTNSLNKTELNSEMKEYTESCKYITEWLIYTNILDIITNFMVKGNTAYTQLFNDMPVKTGTKKFDDFKTKLSNLDDVSIMLMSEMLKSTQNLDVKEFGKQKKNVIGKVFPFNVNYSELEPNSNTHNNMLKMMALLHAFINTKNWGRLEFTMYYRELIKNIVNELSNDHITKDEFNKHREVILKFHKKYNINVNKVKSYGKLSSKLGYTTIESLENMEFITYRELSNALLDMSKGLYPLLCELEDEKTLLNVKSSNVLETFQNN